jgi:hypothetical protein
MRDEMLESVQPLEAKVPQKDSEGPCGKSRIESGTVHQLLVTDFVARSLGTRRFVLGVNLARALWRTAEQRADGWLMANFSTSTPTR